VEGDASDKVVRLRRPSLVDATTGGVGVDGVTTDEVAESSSVMRYDVTITEQAASQIEAEQVSKIACKQRRNQTKG
jgi:hypothetical protein